VTRARETHKANLIERIVAAAKVDWKAASWLLERQFAAEYAPSERRAIERPVAGKDGEPLPQDSSAAPVQLIVNVVRDENDPVRRLFGDKPEPANNPERR
jgi:hypothetical protein